MFPTIIFIYSFTELDRFSHAIFLVRNDVKLKYSFGHLFGVSNEWNSLSTFQASFCPTGCNLSSRSIGL